ncbi:MAG: 2-oxo acid dehydrogenase subunit E2 [Dactylosporangium sp.]|nr:2-oxo acid dehydrogenase subunit E2 [Dactylosporangium sp.]NNJ61587.1 2-oxo acid dehydrogenase subunit E2 [Dactylosporangium sp.]
MSRIREFSLPDLGEGLTAGDIVAWLVREGETIELNQPIVEIETAKAIVEIPAMWPGRVETLLHGEGATVQIGTPIIRIDTDPDRTVRRQDQPPAPRDGGRNHDGAETGEVRQPVLVGYGPRTTKGRRRRPQGTGRDRPDRGERPPVLAKPPVRRLAKDLDVDLSELRGTGRQGTITRQDVLSAIADPVAPPAAGRSTPGASGSDGSGSDASGSPPAREWRVPVRGVRKAIAENTTAVASTVPHATVFHTVDVTRSMRALKRLLALREWQGVQASVLLMVVRAVLLAVRRYPMINASWAGDEIIVRDYVNLGIAVATERGLVVPSIGDAQRLTTRELAEALTTLADTARAGRTSLQDLTSGTMTITNVGVFGIDTGVPLLPRGETAILALGVVREAPWVHRGKIKVRQVATLGLSFDHRIVDGDLASGFLSDVGRFLTDPETALLAWGR